MHRKIYLFSFKENVVTGIKSPQTGYLNLTESLPVLANLVYQTFLGVGPRPPTPMGIPFPW